MRNMRNKTGAALLLVLTGCAGQPDKRPAVPNPAARKCLDDGYRLVAVKKDGVPRWYFCIDPESGKKCEVWAYFRRQCHL